MELSERYNPKESEARWQQFWEDEGIYRFNPASPKSLFTIDTPPPTVSGKMHIGHSFSYSHQDFVARFHRMNGENVFYPFGTDDNGLATERLIEKENRVRSTEMSREKFIDLCLKTLERIRPGFVADWKRLGMSCDWTIFYSTINDHCRSISQKSFIELYKKDRVYRKRKPFMWCPECRTAIAQVEMKDKEKQSKLVYIKFDTSIGEKIIIATTRPEMMAACVAVYVNPADARYKKFIGGKAKIPFFNREAPIHPNPTVDINFGTGAVYHCTFGDMTDAEWVDTFKTDVIEILNKDGTLNEKAGKYKGMKAKDARNAITGDLEKAGLVEKIEPITHVVNVHERCETDIEILQTEQWFIRYLDLKEKFLEAGNKLNWHPGYMKNRYDNWIYGLKWDWSISRQRHFGVPFPVWYCKKCYATIVAGEKHLPVDPLVDRPLKKCDCGSDDFEPEKDVMDTWATSSLTPQIAAALFPKIHDKLYPMDLRPQAHDIITFWLFNTVVKSQMHNNINPWKDVMISGWALDPHGKKMSKSRGNVVEPQAVMEKYSADALRFWAAGSKLGEDLPYQEKDLVTGSKTITKLWNASRFVIMSLADYRPKDTAKLEITDKWLLTKLNRAVTASTDAFKVYEYAAAKSSTEKFFWNFTDYYLEIVKDRLYNSQNYSPAAMESARYTLYTALLSILKLFAPVMPHATEEIYQMFFRQFEKSKSIHVSRWPASGEAYQEEERLGDMAVEIISALRKYKTSKSMSMNKELERVVIDNNAIKPLADVIKTTMKIKQIDFAHIEGGIETENSRLEVYD
ncbi:MAG: valine--tRNA ligase [Candidatus Aenigmarchaeota archaeon]|nr:valine--tRNA ligase [Candidatus Aenigmarchaeota archaeon]